MYILQVEIIIIMPDLDELIAKSFINQEHEETKAQQAEERIRKIHNIDLENHIPKRTWR